VPCKASKKERGESREKIRLWMCICDREYREYRECGGVACLSRSGLIPPCENPAENEPVGSGEVVMIIWNRYVKFSGTGL
jgi:hypothetical protein